MRYNLEEMSGDKYERICLVGKFEGERNALVVNMRKNKCLGGKYERKQMSGR